MAGYIKHNCLFALTPISWHSAFFKTEGLFYCVYVGLSTLEPLININKQILKKKRYMKTAFIIHIYHWNIKLEQQKDPRGGQGEQF